MPRIKAGDSILAGFDPSSPFIPMPERGSVWGQTAQLMTPNVRAIFALQDFASFASAAQHVVASSGLLDGVPDWAMDGFGRFFQSVPLVANGSELAKGLVRGAAQTVDYALQQCATSVPIVGTLVAIGVAMYEAIARALKSDQEQRPPDRAIVYDLASDLLQGNDLVAFSKQGDWTDLFLPASTQGSWQLTDISWTPGGGRQGWMFRPSSANLEYGLLPGIAEQLGVYQFPRKAIGFAGDEKGARPWDFYTGQGLSTTGQVTPSGRKFAAVLWQSAMKPSSVMFNIDSAQLEAAWVAYFDQLWTWSNTVKVGSGSETDLVRWAVKRACVYTDIVPTTSGPKITDSSRVVKFPTSKLRARLGDLTHRYSDIVRYVCQIHRERALAACDTIIAAYVSPQAPLLVDAKIKAAWTAGREKLIARWGSGVEAELVPDDAFRSAILAAQANAPQRTAPPGKRSGAHRPPKPAGQHPSPNAPPQGAPIDVPQGGSVSIGAVATVVALAFAAKRFL